MNIPNKFDKVAAHTAAGTFPLAIEVNAIEDCTVDGSKVKYNVPATNAGSRPGIRINNSPKIGNNANVTASEARWSRQLSIPSTIASRDSLAPCKKNNNTIPASVTNSKKIAPLPRQGNNEAATPTAKSAATNPSITPGAFFKLSMWPRKYRSRQDALGASCTGKKSLPRDIARIVECYRDTWIGMRSNRSG